MSRARLPLWLKFSLLTSALIVTTMGVSSWISIRSEVTSKKADMERRLRSLAMGLATSHLLQEDIDWKHLQESLSALRIEDPSNPGTSNLLGPIVYIAVFDPSGEPRAWMVDPDRVQIVAPDGTEVTRPSAENIREVAEGNISRLADTETVRIDYQDAQDRDFVLELAWSTRPLQRWTRRTVIRDVEIALGLLLLGVLASVALGKWVTRPVATLMRGMERVAEHDFTQQVPVTSRDEIGFLARTFNQMATQLEQGERARNLISKLVSRQVAQELLRRGEEGIRGETRQCTILFADIRGFTPTAEKMKPEDLCALLNEYFTEMVDIVFRHDGILDKFIGDAIMAIWNAPVDQPDGPLRAVKAALEMQHSIDALNEKFRREGRPPIGVGMGISTGDVVAGKMGSSRKWEYTVIGDHVNLAQRIESKTAAGQVRISESTYEILKDQLEVEKLEAFVPKGKSYPVNVYRVIAVREPVPVVR